MSEFGIFNVDRLIRGDFDEESDGSEARAELVEGGFSSAAEARAELGAHYAPEDHCEVFEICPEHPGERLSDCPNRKRPQHDQAEIDRLDAITEQSGLLEDH